MLDAVLTGVYGFAHIALLETCVPSLLFLAIALSLVAHDVMYGPQTALIAESFGARVRYHSGTPIAVFILICAIINLVATAMLGDDTNRDPAD